VKLTVYDVPGREIVPLINKNRAAGHLVVAWNGTDRFGQRLSNCVHLLRLETESFNQTSKLSLLR